MARRSKKPDLEDLRANYNLILGTAKRLEACLREQIGSLVASHSITLGVPLESRVKSWESVAEKIERKGLQFTTVSALHDLVGIRVIALFSRDVLSLTSVVEKTFKVHSIEDTSERLSETQFGYQSRHFVVGLPDAWLALPSYAGLGDIKAEIQLRTVAQHIWAAASHKLQYKRQESVPAPLRRNIYRVSALLETVDLEFDRVLNERDLYRKEVDLNSTNTLDVDTLNLIATKMLPQDNRSDVEDFNKLLLDLEELGVQTSSELRAILENHLPAALAYDRELVNEYRDKEWGDKDRINLGVYLTQAGLIRSALRERFGKELTRPIFMRGWESDD